MHRLLRLVRAPLWWTPKVLPVVAAALLAALTAGVSARDGVPAVLAMVVSATGVAAFAHLINDLADREADRRAGKRNLVDGTSAALVSLLLAATAAVAVLPWLLVPIGVPAAVVLGLLVVTSVLYSAPPVRLKQHGGIGVLADAAVSHLLPTVFAFVLMGSTGQRTTSWWIATVAASCWSLGFGIRSIVVHQILDLDGDRRAGVDTFVSRRGPHRAARSGRDAVALELAGLVVLAGVTLWVAWGAALFFAVHFALWLNHRRWEHPPIDMVPTRVGAWLPLAEFYEVWPAVALGLALTVSDPVWGWLVLGIAVVFWSAVSKQTLDELAMLAEVSAAVTRRVGRWWWAVRSFTTDHANRAYQRLRVVWRETGFALRRAWWALYRFHWGVRDLFGPVVLFVRRQRRRFARIVLRRPPSPPG